MLTVIIFKVVWALKLSSNRARDGSVTSFSLAIGRLDPSMIGTGMAVWCRVSSVTTAPTKPANSALCNYAAAGANLNPLQAEDVRVDKVVHELNR